MYPKFFTPNGDGFNDNWKIQFPESISFSGIKIYDRLGKLIKALDSLSDYWDGNLSGRPLPADDYWFVLIYDKGKIMKGNFSLKR